MTDEAYQEPEELELTVDNSMELRVQFWGPSSTLAFSHEHGELRADMQSWTLHELADWINKAYPRDEGTLIPRDEGTKNAIITAVMQSWPSYASTHGRRDVVPAVRPEGNTAALIELAVETALMMVAKSEQTDGPLFVIPPGEWRRVDMLREWIERTDEATVAPKIGKLLDAAPRLKNVDDLRPHGTTDCQGAEERIDHIVGEINDVSEWLVRHGASGRDSEGNWDLVAALESLFRGVDGEGDQEVWIPPTTDAVCGPPGDKPCWNCGSSYFHQRTRRCAACGRRPKPENPS